MRRAVLASLLALALLASRASGDDQVRRPPFIDEKTWEIVKGEWKEGLEEKVERARQAFGASSLAELEQRREARPNYPLDVGPNLGPLFMGPELTALHAVAFANQTRPRLSGHVVRLGEPGQPGTLRLAFGRVVAGDLVLVPPGRDTLDLMMRMGRRLPSEVAALDVAVVGSGADKTTLAFFPRRVQPTIRLRVEACTLDLSGRQLDVSGSSIELRGCTITGFKAAAITGTNGVVLIDDCTFQGEGPECRVFDLNGDSLVLLRRARFETLGSLSRAAPAFPLTIDGCLKADWLDDDFTEHGPAVFARESPGVLAESVAPTAFAHLTDDEDFVAFAAGERAAPDALSARLAGILDLARSVPYWAGLVGDARPKVRALAARRFTALTGEPAASSVFEPLTGAALDAAVKDLDADDWSRREAATRRLETAGASAQGRLDALARTGAPEARDRARSILTSFAERVLLGNEPERARLLRWWDTNRERIFWDEAKKRWVAKEVR